MRTHYDVPFIGIEPAIKPAALKSVHKSIGILATKGTLSSELFSKTSTLFASGIKVVEQNGEGIVQLIESGQLNSDEMKTLLELYLKPMLEADIDYLVLGCTHYPYLIPQLIELLPKHVKIIDSGEAVARQTKAVLKSHKLLNSEKEVIKNEFYSNLNNISLLKNLIGEKHKIQLLNF